MNANLIRKTLGDYRWPVLWYSLGVAAYGLFIMWFYPTIANNPTFDQLLQTYPRELLEAFGVSGNISRFPGFISGEYFSFMWIVVVVPLAIAAGTAAVALEIDRGTIQALLAMPLSRVQLVASKWLSMAALLLLVVVISIGTLLLGAWWFDIEVEVDRLLEVGALGWTFFLALGSLALLCSAVSHERGRAVGVAIGLTAYFYVANVVARLKESLDFLRSTTLFALWKPQAVLEGRDAPWEELALLAAISLACLLAAALWCRRRDFAP